jgi:hypothetical protein
MSAARRTASSHTHTRTHTHPHSSCPVGLAQVSRMTPRLHWHGQRPLAHTNTQTHPHTPTHTHTHTHTHKHTHTHTHTNTHTHTHTSTHPHSSCPAGLAQVSHMTPRPHWHGQRPLQSCREVCPPVRACSQQDEGRETENEKEGDRVTCSEEGKDKRDAVKRKG